MVSTAAARSRADSEDFSLSCANVAKSASFFWQTETEWDFALIFVFDCCSIQVTADGWRWLGRRLNSWIESWTIYSTSKISAKWTSEGQTIRKIFMIFPLSENNWCRETPTKINERLSWKRQPLNFAKNWFVETIHIWILKNSKNTLKKGRICLNN